MSGRGRIKSVSELPMSADTRKLNPSLAGGVSLSAGAHPIVGKTRLRQSSKPLMNSNELAFQAYLQATCAPGAFIYAQAITLRLANGVRYTPDFASFEPMGNGLMRFWEVKGQRKIFDGAGEKLKIAAGQFPAFVFILVWCVAGVWQQQRIHS